MPYSTKGVEAQELCVAAFMVRDEAATMTRKAAATHVERRQVLLATEEQDKVRPLAS